MKTKHIHIALLLGALAFSAYATGQQELIQEDKYELVDPSNIAQTEPFKALIFPNPSYTGTVKISWNEEHDVDRITVSNILFDELVHINIKDENEIKLYSLQEGFYFVKFYSQNELLKTQKMQVIRQ